MALVILRKAKKQCEPNEPGHSFTVGDATITVFEIKGQSVKLSIDAPPHVNIVRDDCKSGAGRHRDQHKNRKEQGGEQA